MAFVLAGLALDAAMAVAGVARRSGQSSHEEAGYARVQGLNEEEQVVLARRLLEVS